MKLYKNKNVVAALTTLTLLSTPIISKGVDNNLDAYYDDTSINVEKRNSFTLRINKKKLEELINSSEEDIITIKIEDKKMMISREELISLKNKADEYDKKNIEYTIVISLVGTLTIGTVILKEKAKQKLYD
ncbi:MAG: hypothetical protein IKF91_01610 [Bacilli bacterium]|nr:hypothetical protein [Bacilli bacterium]